MPGATALRQIQLGAEATPGTSPGAATALYRGMGSIEDDLTLEELEEHIGQLAGSDQTYLTRLAGKLIMESTAASFEQLPYILEAGVKKIGTGTQDGTGSDYIYDYLFSGLSQNTLQSYEIKAGDDQQCEDFLYGLVTSFTLEGAMDAAVKVAAEWIGQDVNTDTFDSLSVPAIDPIVAAKGLLYIDDVGSGFGTTAKSNTLLNWTLSVQTGVTPIFTADNGVLYFQSHKIVEPEIMLDITFEHDGTAVAEKANWRNQTKRAIQLKVEGPGVATPGTTYSNKTLILNLPGYWTKFAAITDQDGNSTVTGTFKSRYNATLAQAAQIIVVNELTALP